MEEENFEMVKQKLEEIAKEHGFTGNHEIKIIPTSTAGANYSSTLYFATIVDPFKENMDLFVKLSNLNQEMVEEFVQGLNVFKMEYDLYNFINTTYKALEEKYNVLENKRINIPKIYKGYFEPGEEFLIFEDLTKKGYQDYNRFKSVTWEYAAKAVEQLANLHALSMAHQILEPESAANILKQAPTLSEKMKIFQTMTEELAKVSIPVDEDKKERLDNFFKSGKLFDGSLFDLPIKRPVLGHGDFRSSNLMHRRKNGTLEIAMLDFQIMTVSSPVLDLLYLIFLCTDGQFRKLHYQELVDQYYKELKGALERFDLDPKEVYSKKDFQEEYSKFLIFGLIMSLSTLSLVLVEPEHAPNIGAEGMNFMVNMKQSETYRQRLDEVLDDYIAWGLL